ncbi:MAG: hypothetical protein IIY23_04710 [Erysipelotrichaceae bacterium]|nr:hypothetical protein [Erysipelotrichaceae bacterium]
MKKLAIIIMTLLAVMLLVGCGQKKEEPAPTAEPTSETTPEPTEETVRVPVPEKYQGMYHDAIAGRAQLTLTSDKIEISWSNSAYDKAFYELPVSYDEANNRITYENGKLTEIVFESAEKHSDTVMYENGTGYFDIEEGKLLWQDDMAETPDTVIFVQSDSMVNPWIYTDSREEAMEYSGVEFEPPIQEAIPEGYKYVLYAARDGVIRMIFTNGETELAISKSNSFSGLELSGDFREYSKNWEEHHKGVAIDCYGDGDTINLAYFGTTTTNFSVNVYDTTHTVNEGNGLTIDQITSLISGMQP